MTDLQKIELGILEEFKRICENHNLRYFAIGGTCIGAVRHQGFIPWDDDIDVAMPFGDYKAFIKFAKKEIQKPYSLYLHKDHPHWYRNFIKLQNDNTTFAEPDCEIYPDRYTGVYIDVMPLYGMPKGKIAQWFMTNLNDFYHYMNRRHRIPYTNGLRVLNHVEKIISFFYGKRRKDINLYNYRLNKKFSKYSFDNSDKILFGWRDRIDIRYLPFNYKTVFNYKDFKSYKEVPFEDTVIRIPVGYDEYLQTEFGDYMQLPPMEKRIHHETAIVDLHKSYKEYRERKDNGNRIYNRCL